MPEIRGNIEEIYAKVEEFFRRMPSPPRNRENMYCNACQKWYPPELDVVEPRQPCDDELPF